jgi:hypothetical protein
LLEAIRAKRKKNRKNRTFKRELDYENRYNPGSRRCGSSPMP